MDKHVSYLHICKTDKQVAQCHVGLRFAALSDLLVCGYLDVACLSRWDTVFCFNRKHVAQL